MNQRIHIGQRPVASSSQQRPAQPQASQAPASGAAFLDLLDGALHPPVKLSGHAQERLGACRRMLTETEMKDLAKAVDRAAEKGARDALILMRDLALVVSITNRTVITAVDGDRLKENIFTKIDSAVILG